MRTEIPLVVLDNTGAPVAGGQVTVALRGGDPTTVYAGSSGVTPLTNPLTSDAYGRVTGWVERGSYQATVVASDIATYTEYFESMPGGDGGVDYGALEDALKPSAGAAPSAETLRALGSGDPDKAAPGLHATEHTDFDGGDTINWQAINGRGLFLDMPDPTTVLPGVRYWAYDVGAVYYNTGTAWELEGGAPPGTIHATARAAAPAGYVLCDGTVYDGTLPQYEALYTALAGTPFVDSGAHTVTAPDLRGRVVVGVSPGGKAEVDALGDSDGVAANLRNVSHIHTYTRPDNVDEAFVSGGDPGDTGISVGASTSGDVNNLNRPAYMAINYIIKL